VCQRICLLVFITLTFYLPTSLHRLIRCSVCVPTASCDWVGSARIKNVLRLLHQKQAIESSELKCTCKNKVTIPPFHFCKRDNRGRCLFLHLLKHNEAVTVHTVYVTCVLNAGKIIRTACSVYNVHANRIQELRVKQLFMSLSLSLSLLLICFYFLWRSRKLQQREDFTYKQQTAVVQRIAVMNLLTTLALYALKEHVNNVKLYFRSTGEKSVYKKCCEKGILESLHH
jgi:hypothetical protein